MVIGPVQAVENMVSALLATLLWVWVKCGSCARRSELFVDNRGSFEIVLTAVPW